VTIAYAAVHQRLRYRGEDTGLYVVALDDGTVFVNSRPPVLFDRDVFKIPMRELEELLPGTRVNISYGFNQRRRKIVEAIQVLSEPAQPAPFKPVPSAHDDQ